MKNQKITEFTDEDERKQTSNFFDFNEEKEIVGVLETIQEGAFGNEYHINTGDHIVIVGSYKELSSKISNDDIGRTLKIACVGETKSKTGRIYKNFKVFVKSAP